MFEIGKAEIVSGNLTKTSVMTSKLSVTSAVVSEVLSKIFRIKKSVKDNILKFVSTLVTHNPLLSIQKNRYMVPIVRDAKNITLL